MPWLKCISNGEASVSWLVLRKSIGGLQKALFHWTVNFTSLRVMRSSLWDVPSYTATLYARYVSYLNAAWPECWAERCLSSNSLLLVAVLCNWKRKKQYVVLYLLDVMRGVIKMTRQSEFQKGEKSSSKSIIDLSIRLRSRLDMKIGGSFYRDLARGGWVMRVCVGWMALIWSSVRQEEFVLRIWAMISYS